MAIDTKEKRANIPGVGRPWMRDKFPVAVPDEQWRIASGLAYGGNVLTPPEVTPLGTTTGIMRVNPRMTGHLRVEPRTSGNILVESQTTEGLRLRET